jgi:transposase
MRENHLSLFETAVRFGIPTESTVLQWERVYERDGVAGFFRDNRSQMKNKDKQVQPSKFQGEDNELLLQELELLRAENAYLKKLKVLVQERIAREIGNKQKPSTN